MVILPPSSVKTVLIREILQFSPKQDQRVKLLRGDLPVPFDDTNLPVVNRFVASVVDKS